MTRKKMLDAICIIDSNNGEKIKLSDMKFIDMVLSDEDLTKLYDGLKKHGKIGTMEFVKKERKKNE